MSDDQIIFLVELGIPLPLIVNNVIEEVTNNFILTHQVELESQEKSQKLAQRI